MSFTIRIATLYKQGSDPKARNAPWVQVILRCDSPVDRANCILEQHTGTEKLSTNPDIAEAVTAIDAESQFDQIVQTWERKGFKLHVDHRTSPTR